MYAIKPDKARSLLSANFSTYSYVINVMLYAACDCIIVCNMQGTKKSFLTQQLSCKTGVSHSQLKCGAYMLKSKVQVVQQSQELQFKDGYLCEDDKDEVVNSQMEFQREGWILDVQRLDGTKVSVHVPRNPKVSTLSSPHDLLAYLTTCYHFI